jgi:hypothetical protein
MLISDRALLDAEALFSNLSKDNELAAANAPQSAPKRRRRIVRDLTPIRPADEGEAATGRRVEAKTATEALQSLRGNGRARRAPEAPAPQPVEEAPVQEAPVARRRVARPKVVRSAPRPVIVREGDAFVVNVRLSRLGAVIAEERLVVRAPDLVTALKSWTPAIGRLIERRYPGATWELFLVERLGPVLN